MSESLGEALPKLMARVRDKILPIYLEIGPSGAIAVILIRADLDRATKAMIEGDLPGMIRAYQALKEIKT